MNLNEEFEIDFIVSQDGTRIGFRKIGDGPALILVHGGLQSSLNFTKLAKLLSHDFTVYIPDRRGRGISGPYKENDNLSTEAGDILALIHQTNAVQIFGLSSGAIIALQSAILSPAVKKIALYEPPIPLDGGKLAKMVNTYQNAMNKGNRGKAFIAILKGTGDPGDRSLLNMLPGFITAPFINVMMKAQKNKRLENELLLYDLVGTFHHDCIVFTKSSQLVEKARYIQADVLLMSGSDSQPYFKPVLDALMETIPKVTRTEFKKLGHLAADNMGCPVKIAEQLISFYKTGLPCRT